ncbi:VOC family protein [Chitinivorax sp. B]|uniref:VOC family protein n=1 Tax=Chitinivorax sp. B TaxID=2502235 RepID=UPI0010F56420|nr:VOC family protein [Chitinivorax sp. B]
MNAINWFEIPAADFDRAVRFYQTVYHADLRVEACADDTPVAILPYDQQTGVGGSIVKGLNLQPNEAGVRIYLNGGQDLTVMLGRVNEAGGEIVMEKTKLPGDIGYIAQFRDSEGNVIGLHSTH